MSDHVVANSGECADLLKLDIKSLYAFAVDRGRLHVKQPSANECSGVAGQQCIVKQRANVNRHFEIYVGI